MYRRTERPTVINCDFGIGIITGIILCILQGVGTINIGWFWATFPFWIVPATSIAIFLVILIICGIIALCTGRD